MTASWQTLTICTAYAWGLTINIYRATSSICWWYRPVLPSWLLSLLLLFLWFLLSEVFTKSMVSCGWCLWSRPEQWFCWHSLVLWLVPSSCQCFQSSPLASSLSQLGIWSGRRRWWLATVRSTYKHLWGKHPGGKRSWAESHCRV